MRYQILIVNCSVLLFFSVISYGQSPAEIKPPPYKDIPGSVPVPPRLMSTGQTESGRVPVTENSQQPGEKIELKKVPESEVKDKVPAPQAIRGKEGF